MARRTGKELIESPPVIAKDPLINPGSSLPIPGPGGGSTNVVAEIIPIETDEPTGGGGTGVGEVILPPVEPPVIRPAPPRPPATPPNNANEMVFVFPKDDVELVNAIADAIHKPPPTLEKWYVDLVVWVDSYLKGEKSRKTTRQPTLPSTPLAIPRTTTTTSNARPLYMGEDLPGPGSPTTPTELPNNSLERNACSEAQANILKLVEDIVLFSTKARKAGYQPPDNPFVVIAQMNSERGNSFDPINIDPKYARDLVYNIKVLVDLLDAQNQGAINFDNSNPIDIAQLGNITLSFNGFGGSGNAAADILTFLPSSDQIKQNIAQQELAALDFTKRVPYLLFTLDYEMEGKKGVLLGWRKISDASGFIIKRHSVFSNRESEVLIYNDRVSADTKKFLSYAKTHALMYMEEMDPTSIQLYFDDTLVAEEYYVFTIRAFQMQSKPGVIFSCESKPVNFSNDTANRIQQILVKMDPNMRRITGWIPAPTWDSEPEPIYSIVPSTISPWPAYAEFFLGDSAYDWVLAAINIRASINRKESKETTRKYSYLNASSGFLESAAASGKFVTPTDNIGKIISNVEESISSYGVVQTILEIFQETGITYYFDGRDPRDNGVFDRAGNESAHSSNIFRIIATAIDPDTATVDLKVVAHNMLQLVNTAGTSLNTDTVLYTGRNRVEPSELFIPDPDKTTNELADTSLQFIASLQKMGDSVVDLTTFDGISKLVRVIRIYSDYGPDKIKAQQVDMPPQPPKPPKPPDPPPPPPEPPEELPPDPPADTVPEGSDTGGTSGGDGGAGGTTGGDGGGNACMDPETPILLANETSIPLKNIKPGDLIVTVPETGGVGMSVWKVGSKEILENVRVRVTTHDNRSFICSVNHGLCSNGVWRRADTFKPGEKLDGFPPSTIRSVEYLGLGPVVRIEVPGAGTYMVGDGTWHHNAKAQKIIP